MVGFGIALIGMSIVCWVLRRPLYRFFQWFNPFVREGDWWYELNRKFCYYVMPVLGVALGFTFLLAAANGGQLC